MSQTGYRLVKYTLWPVTLAVLVVTPLAYAGTTQPYIGVPPMFAGGYSPLVVMTAAVATTALVVTLSRNVAWVRAGRKAGFSPAWIGLLSRKRPELSGTVDGREVRIVPREHATAFKAVLERTPSDGAVLGPVSDDDTSLTPFDVPADADLRRDGIGVVGGSEALAESLLSGQVLSALDAHGDRHQMYAGDLTAVYEMPDSESGGGKEFDIRWDLFRAHQDGYDGRETWVGDSGTVSHIVPKTVTDPERFTDEATLVTAVADAFESGA